MLRPIITVRTAFEIFEFFNFVDHSEWNHLLRFSTRYDAQSFLRRILDDTRDPHLLGDLWRGIGNQIIPCNYCNMLELLAGELVDGYLKVKRTPLVHPKLSPSEREYFTARFDELRAKNALVLYASARSDPVMEATPSPPPPEPPTSESAPVPSPTPSTETTSQSMTVAALQMYSEDGQIQENLNTAEQLARDAKQANPELDLILFPELTSPGYGVGPHTILPDSERQKLAQDLWKAAEPSSGNQTLQKLQAVAKELQVMIGASFL